MKMLKKGKLKFSNVSGEGRDTGVRKKNLCMEFASVVLRLTQEEEKMGILKTIPPPKKALYNLEIHA